MDLISIIVPVYNVESYLERCIDSILNQTYTNLEIVLVNDGSKDKSGHICELYKNKDKRVRVIHKENRGLGFARNSGLEIVTGKYVTFIDGDDYIGSKHIETMFDLITKTGTDTCIGGHTRVNMTNYVPHVNVCADKVFFKNVKEQILPRMCGANNAGQDYIEMSVCMVMFSNQIIQDHHLRFVSERIHISEDLMFDFAYYPLSKGVCCSNICDYYYCNNDGSLTTKYRTDRFSSQVKLYKEIRYKAEELGIQAACIPRLNTTLIAIARYTIKLEYKFSKEIGITESQAHVRDICMDPLLIEVMRKYDDKGTKISSRIVNYLIKKRLYLALKLAMKVKNLLNL